MRSLIPAFCVLRSRSVLTLSLLLAIFLASACKASGPQQWEYKTETFLYDEVCATEVLTPYQDNDVVRQDIVGNHGYSREAVAALWLFLPYVDYMPQSQVERILADYARCGEDAFNDYINEMGKQGWEMVSSEHLQITEPGGQWISDITVGYGYEISWKRPK
jgi:hypothetical protein